MFLSDHLAANGGFISPFKTTPRRHLGRNSWVRGRRILTHLIMLWMVSSCMAVGIFNILGTLAIEDLWTLRVFTCLFSAKRWARYSASVTYERTVCLYHWPTWQRPSTESYTRYWISLWGDQSPFPLLFQESDAVWADPSLIKSTQLYPIGKDLCGTGVAKFGNVLAQGYICQRYVRTKTELE